MTVSNTNVVVSHIGNGVTTSFPYTFLIPMGAAVVTRTVIATGVEGAALVNGVDYSISGLGSESGGSVTYPLSGSPLASTHKLNIRRNSAIAQSYDMTTQSAYDPATLEGQLDNMVRSLLEHAEKLTRAVLVGTGSALSQSDFLTSLQTLIADAQTAATNAAASYDSFDDRYLGPKAVAPVLDNDGAALLTGALYFNTATNAMMVYTGAAWTAAYAASTDYPLKVNNLSDMTSRYTSLINLLGVAVTIASAATVDLSDQAVNTGFGVTISGAVGISAFTLDAEQVQLVRFSGAPLITAGANLVIHGRNASLTMEAGDMAWLWRNGAVVYFLHVPLRTQATTTEVLAGTDTVKAATPDALAALWEKGADIASAATITIGEGGVFHVTGVTGITDIDFAPAKDGRAVWLIFDGALTLTHNATTLILPGAANISTSAGDRGLFYQDNNDNVVCLAYIKANGQAVVTSAGGPTLGTEQATTSGTTKDFPIPAGAKRVTVMLNGVSVTTAVTIGVQLGDSGGIETTGYDSVAGFIFDTASADSDGATDKFMVNPLTGASAGNNINGSMTLTRMNASHLWVASGVFCEGGGNVNVFMSAGSKTLSAELVTVRLMGGTFDAGSVNVMYE